MCYNYSMKTIKLPCFGILVVCDPSNGAGTVMSDLSKDARSGEPNLRFEDAIDTMESMILAHACAGVDIESAGYIEGIETAVEKICNEYT
jgi:hypothetical protein